MLLSDLFFLSQLLKFLVRYEFTFDDVTITGILDNNVAMKMKKVVVGISLIPRPFGRRKTAGYARLAHSTIFPKINSNNNNNNNNNNNL